MARSKRNSNITLTQEQFDTLLASRETQAPRAPRPTIGLDASEEDWRLFIFQWGRYKNSARLTPTAAADQLLSACSPELERRLFNLRGTSLSTIAEEELLRQIKSVAVRGLHTAVHRRQFHSMRQGEGEDLAQFVARLRAKAALCDFNIMAHRPVADSTEPGPLSYENDALQTQLVVGLYNLEHQNKILAAADQCPDFDRTYERLQAMQTAENSEKSLQDSASRDTPSTNETPQLQHDTTAAHRSAYRQQRYQKTTQQTGQNRPAVKTALCSWCGERHKMANTRFQDGACPARGKTCSHCHKLNHLARACRNKQPSHLSSESSTDPFGAELGEFSAQAHMSDSVAPSTVSATGAAPSKSQNDAQRRDVPHMEWDGDQFVPSAPKRHPELAITITVMQDAHNKLGKYLSGKERARVVNGARTTGCADTGAMTCSGGMELLELLHCPERFLLKTSHRIHGVTGTSLDVLGSLLLRIEANGRVTRQVVYISRNTHGIYLSERALRDLGAVAGCFPAPATSVTAGASASQPQEGCAPCGCPKRSAVPELPTAIPYPATEENREKLEQWMRSHFAASAFNTCEHQPLQEMSGPPVDIHFLPDVTPEAVHTPIPVPFHWKQQVKADLDQDVRLGIIEPVPQGTPTRWCSRMVVTAKKDGSPRRTVDLTNVNKATLRETHHTPTPFNLVADIPTGTKKTVLDAWNGYHSLPLAEEARDATTFITEFGRYRYKRAPQGFHASGDGYTRRMDDITEGVERLKKCVDDSLLWDKTLEDSFWHTMNYITLCGKNGVVFNPSKFVFGADTVDFAGFTVTPSGYKPTARLLDAIRDFPTPTNITGVRSWFGLVNQVSYAFAQSKVMAPFRELLKTKENRKFFWDDSLDLLFKRSKTVITQHVEDGVRAFEANRPTCLSTDWSKTGIGFMLQQKHCSCSLENAPHCGPGHWKLVFAGSRFTTESEARYAPVEGEALALVYGLQQARMFVMGCPNLIVVVDHKPLVKLFSDQMLEKIKNPRLFSLKEKSLMFRFTIKYIPGKLNSGPDAASRYPPPSEKASLLTALCGEPSTEETEAASRMHESMVASAKIATSSAPSDGFRAISWEIVKAECATDQTSLELVDMISRGFPESRSETPESLRVFWPMRHELHQLEGVPFHEHKMFVPKSLRAEVLDCLHSAHQGEVGMKSSARYRFFWPGMDAAITQKRAQCRTCQRIAPSQPAEPPLDPPCPEFPFEMVAIDFFELAGNHYMVCVDRYSGWMHISKQTYGSFEPLAAELNNYFRHWGVPQVVESDGGPPFNGDEFKMFLKKWDIKHRLSSAHYPQSNGRAEVAVKTAKRLLQENTSRSGHLNTGQVTRALLQYHNTPGRGPTAESPAQIIFGRYLRDGLPFPRFARPEWGKLRNLRERGHSQLHAKVVDKRCLEPLEEGDTVLVQNQRGPAPKRWERTGDVVEKLGNRQYSIRMHGSGRITLRNRRFLKKLQTLNPARSRHQTSASQERSSSHEHQPASQQKTPESRPQGPAHSEPRTVTLIRRQPPRAAKTPKGGMKGS